MIIPDIAWMAGFYEGEGCAYISQNRAIVSISSTDLDVLERVQSMFKGSIREDQQSGLGKKTIYRWRLSHHKLIYRLLASMLPYLGTRRAHKALDILDFIDEKHS